ncbi:MAG TPA: hypothetical protein VNT00_17795 [Eoetvoesiella sp.]|jgi:hypothetical protein|uniref:hypothetical protein n=1 Tax=Eoetvoesiella sp. TaxID=1966355 RepID=UPI002B60CCC2|nr:hypothetical protein [Eoetvoesiella sp.]HWK63277.1 hypothetical protein [Eoetvoesiella sp.]
MNPPRKIDPQVQSAANGKPPSMTSWSNETRAQIEAQYRAWERISTKMVKSAEDLSKDAPAVYSKEEMLQLDTMLKNMRQLSLWLGGEMGQKIEMLHTVTKLAYERHLAHFAKVHASQN